MKEIFEELEAEIDQNVVDRKCDEIERKNLLIANENLIDNWLTQEVFYTTTDSVLTVSRFTEMNDTYTVVQKLFVIGKLKEKLQGKGNTIRELKERISQMKEKHSEANPFLDFKALDSHNKALTEKVNVLQDLNEHFRAENKKVKQHYKELYDSIKITRAKTIEKTNSLLIKNEKLKAQIKGKMPCVTMPTEKPKVLAPGMYAINVEPIPPHNRNNREVHLDYLKHLKESLETLHEIIEEARVERPLDDN
ncbi:hypothetical protein Tco_0005959 [Tanacetum coccineum]